jgi:hypothetical protein
MMVFRSSSSRFFISPTPVPTTASFACVDVVGHVDADVDVVRRDVAHDGDVAAAAAEAPPAPRSLSLEFCMSGAPGVVSCVCDGRALVDNVLGLTQLRSLYVNSVVFAGPEIGALTNLTDWWCCGCARRRCTCRRR